MLYLGTSPCEPAVADLLNRRRIGLMCQPASNPPKAGWLWAADNGCFNAKWDETRWVTWLTKGHPRAGCLFAVVPDVVGDAAATLERFPTYSRVVRDAGYPVAFVAQDGQEHLPVPWTDIDVLFIGGSTEWKKSELARKLAGRARDYGKWVHVGRCNSGRRYRSWAMHADSCDGSFLAWGPATNTPRLVRWLDGYDANPQFDYSEAR